VSLCLTGAGVTVAMAWTAFTLSWTHTVEKVEWQEDWRVSTSGMQIVEARVKGTGAGMEPPPDATLDGGWWRYRPRVPTLPRLVLARSSGVDDWQLCQQGDCTTIGSLLGANAATVTLAPCDRP
jgi:hypothetical protein